MAMRSLIAGLILSLSACSTPLKPTSLPTPQVLQVAYPPSLRPFIVTLQVCAQNFPGVALLTTELPSSHLDLKNEDIVISLGDPGTPLPVQLLIGQDELRVAVNPMNPVVDLTVLQIQELFSGNIHSWREIGGDDTDVSVWIYPPSNEIQDLFTASIMQVDRYSAYSSIAPDPQAMLEAIAGDPGAIGVIPHSWENDQVRLITTSEIIEIPILALTAQEPEALVREFLACVQAAAHRMEGQPQGTP